MPERIIAVFCDGGCIGRNPSPIGGTWAWCAVSELGARVLQDTGVIPGFCTNNLSEFVAAVLALEAMGAGWSGRLYSDSRITLGRLCPEWWEAGEHHLQPVCWALGGLPPEWTGRARSVLGRLGHWGGVLVQGHPTQADLAAGVGGRSGLLVSEHNVYVDALCRQTGRDYWNRRALTALASTKGASS